MFTSGAALIAALIVAFPAIAADLAHYGKLPGWEAAEISPDGRRLASIRTNGEQRQILVADLQTLKTIGGVAGGDVKVRDIQWADNDHLLITSTKTTSISGLDAARADWAVAVVYDVTTGITKPLLNLKQAGNRSGPTEYLNVIIDRPVVRIIDGKTMVFVQGVSFPESRGVNTVFRTDLATGRTSVVFTGNEDTRDVLINAEGQIAAELQHNSYSDVSRLKIRGERGLRETLLPENAVGFSLAGFNADGKVLAYYRPKGGESVLAEPSTSSRDWRRIDGGEDASAMFDSLTGQLTGFHTLKGDVETYAYTDAKDQRAWQAIQKAFAGDLLAPASYSTDRTKIVVFSDSPTEGPGYALVDLSTGQARFFGEIYPGIKPEDISPVKAISYQAADGQKITGYLTLPAGKPANALPLIVLPHGGPAARDTLGFDWWSQALASRGYAVLRPNFRGSSGLGQTFMEAGFGEFGRKMQTDLSDGVRHLAAEGTIDPKRVCIVGASYGGYAALAGAALDTGVYRCAVSVAGPSDLRRMLVTERDDSGVGAFRYWKRFMGVEGLRDPDLSAISPASHAAAVTIPVMLIHGKDDTVVLYEQSRIMADALKKAGKSVDFVTLDGEDHWLSRGATRLKMLEAVTTFVEKNNPPG